METSLIGPISICLGIFSCLICWIAVNGEKDHSEQIKHFEKRFNISSEDGENLENAIKALVAENPKLVGKFGEAMTALFMNQPPENKEEFMDCLYTFCRTLEIAEPSKVEVSRNVKFGDKQIDMILVNKIRRHVGIVIEGEFNGDPEGALNRTIDNKFMDVFQDEKFAKDKIEDKILMGIAVMKNGGAAVSYLVNSTDIADAITIIRTI